VLHHACYGGLFETVKFCVEHGVNPLALNQNALSAMDIARDYRGCGRSFLDIYRWLQALYREPACSVPPVHHSSPVGGAVAAPLEKKRKGGMMCFKLYVKTAESQPLAVNIRCASAASFAVLMNHIRTKLDRCSLPWEGLTLLELPDGRTVHDNKSLKSLLLALCRPGTTATLIA